MNSFGQIETTVTPTFPYLQVLVDGTSLGYKKTLVGVGHSVGVASSVVPPLHRYQRLFVVVGNRGRRWVGYWGLD